MADIQLKYLQDLEAAGNIANTDLMHVNQNGLDRSVTISVIMRLVIDTLLPVGSVHFRSDSANPNSLFPGTTWVKLAAGRNIRTASENGSDVLATGGSDSVTLDGNNLPAHSHTFQNGITSAIGDHIHNTWTGGAGAHTHGAYTDAQGNHTHRAWTDAQGEHSHNLYGANANVGGNTTIRPDATGGGGAERVFGYTTSAGNHAHNVGMDAAGNHGHNITVNAVGDHAHAVGMNGAGAHQHSVTGTITSSGSNTAFSVVNAHVKLAAWRRTQ